MKKIYLLGGAILTIALLVFFNLPKSDKEPFKPLLERTGRISTSSEWLNAKQAIITLQDKIRQNPKDSKSKLLLALAYMQEARVTGEHPYYYPAAIELIEEVLASKRIDNEMKYEALVAKGTVLLSLHKFSDALSVGKEALAVNANNASVYGILCDANVELGNYEEAVKMADKMVSIRPDLRSYSRVSYLREIHGDMIGAIEAMKMAVSAGYPGLEQTSWTRITLGQLYERNGDLSNAEVQYRLTLEEYPSYPFAVGGLARLEAKKKNYDEAINLYKEAGDIIPEFSFKEELAYLYKNINKNAEADEAVEELIEMLEEDEEAGHEVGLELAMIHADLTGNSDKALSYVENEYKKRPANIDVCKTYAYILYKNGDYKKANELLLTASRTKKQEPSLLCLTGLVNCKMGDKNSGVLLIKKSLDMDPYQNTSISIEGKKIISSTIANLD